jgi:putative transposase
MPPHFHKHIRLAGRDYTQGAYFVTLCTVQRQESFGRILGTGTDARMDLNDAGCIVDECWRAIPDHFAHARLDQTQIMPDHLHAILILAPIGSTRWVDATGASNDDRAIRDAPDPTSAIHPRPNGPKRGSLGAIVGAFKSVTMKRINAIIGQTAANQNALNPNTRIRTVDPPGRQRVWLEGYHDRAIRRHGGEFERIAKYIAENPENWR